MKELLSKSAAAYVRTVNEGDNKGFVELFDEDAMVDDAGRKFCGLEAIGAWADSDIFSANVTFEVLNASGDEGDTTLTAKVDGTFDRTGLPDPLILSFRVMSQNERITGLTCRLADAVKNECELR